MPLYRQNPEPDDPVSEGTVNSDQHMSGSSEGGEEAQENPQQDLEPGEDLQEYYRGGDSSNGEDEQNEEHEYDVDDAGIDSYDEDSGSENDEDFAENALEDFEGQRNGSDNEEHQSQQKIQLVEHTSPDTMLYAPPRSEKEDQHNGTSSGQPARILTSNVALGSLLKYDTPISVSKAAFAADEAMILASPPDGARPVSAGQTMGAEMRQTPSTSTVEQILAGALGSSSSGSSMSGANKKGMQQVIDMILPPIVWEQDGQLWMQQVSSKPATRLDVLNLQRLLDIRLEHRQAKETGICPLRRELYTQAFDELIRQVTVNCAERGLLLLRVRDELKMTLAAYQTLFESSCAFGIRKTLQAREGREELERRVENLEKEKRNLLDECDRLKGQLEDAKRLHEEQRAVEAETQREKVEFYQHKVQQIKNQLEAILAAKK